MPDKSSLGAVARSQQKKERKRQIIIQNGREHALQQDGKIGEGKYI